MKCNLCLLNLSSNDLKDLGPGVFDGLGRLRHLDLSCKHIDSHFFDGLRRTGSCERDTPRGTLDLSENKIKTIDDGAFRGFCFLRELKLAVPTKFPYRSILVNLKGLSSLRRLLIKRFPQQSVLGITMQGLHSISHLRIMSCNMPKIQNRFLEDSHVLKTLVITSSQIKYLEPECFQGLKSLSELDLSNNKLEYINKTVLQDLQLLQKLNLSYNMFNSIHENVFNAQTSLKFLDLNCNRLVTLGKESLSHLTQLRELRFFDESLNCLVYGKNKIESVHSGAFSGLFSLKSLQLPYIPLNKSTNVTLNSLYRLDSFNGPGHFGANDSPVMKNLNFVETGVVDTNPIEKWLQQVLYLTNALHLDIYNLNSLTELISFSGFRISTLELRNSKVRIIEENGLKGISRLKSLKIESYTGVTIQKGAFNNLTSLQDLTLYSKRGFLLHPGAFQELPNLKRLVLEKDIFEEGKISPRRELFKGLRNVKELRILSNGIQSLGVGNLLELEQLEVLDLSKNRISSVDEGAFRGLRKIEKIYLSSNKIKSVVVGAICDAEFSLTCANLTRLSKFCDVSFALDSLTHLNLGHNQITFIHQHAFLGCNKLHTLILSWNQIQTLDFLYTPQLTILEFESNRNVSKTTNSTFMCTSELSYINFYFTNIEFVDLSTFHHLKSLNKMHLPKLRCDCRFREFWLWIRTRNVQYRHPDRAFYDVQCNGENLDMFLSKMECNNSVNHTDKEESKTSSADNFVYFKLYIEPIVFILIFVSGCLGNGLLLFIIFRHSDMRNKKNACIVHLAIADVLSLVLNLPLSYWDIEHVDWDLGETTCKVFISSKDLVVALVVFTVVAVTFERFHVVRTSFKLRSSYGSNVGPALLLGITWIYSLLTSIPSYMSATFDGRCFSSLPGRDDYVQRIWTFQFLMNCFLPIVCIILLNIITANTLKKSLRKIPGEIRSQSRYRSRNTVVNVVVVLSAVFTLSYLPNFLLRTLVSWSVWSAEEVLWYSFVTYCFFFLHTILNPFALFIMGSKYKFYITKYVRYHALENEPVSSTPQNVETAIGNICRMLQNLGNGLEGIQRGGECQIIFDDVVVRDELARRERQERLKRIQVRFN